MANIKNLIKFYLSYLRYLLLPHPKKEIIKLAFQQQEKDGLNNIPVFIISFNRLSYVRNIVSQLENLGFKNINIIDNNSSYPPLIEYLNKTPHKVFWLEQNYGHMVFWENPVFEQYREGFYIVTDPDLDFLDSCPRDLVEQQFSILKKYPFVKKVGTSLKIDDLPDDSLMKKDIVKWEKQFSKVYFRHIHAYLAKIDTTYALYVPDSFKIDYGFYSAFRMKYPYQVRHIPWYKTENDITEEDIYYSNNKKNGWFDPVQGFAKDKDRYVN